MMDIEDKPKFEGNSCSEKVKLHVNAKSPDEVASCEGIGTPEQGACCTTRASKSQRKVVSPTLPPAPPTTAASSFSSQLQDLQAAGVDGDTSLTRSLYEKELNV